MRRAVLSGPDGPGLRSQSVTPPEAGVRDAPEVSARGRDAPGGGATRALVV